MLGIRASALAQLGSGYGQAAVLHGTGARAALLWLAQGQVVGVDRRWLAACPAPDEPTS